MKMHHFRRKRGCIKGREENRVQTKTEIKERQESEERGSKGGKKVEGKRRRFEENERETSFHSWSFHSFISSFHGETNDIPSKSGIWEEQVKGLRRERERTFFYEGGREREKRKNERGIFLLFERNEAKRLDKHIGKVE